MASTEPGDTSFEKSSEICGIREIPRNKRLDYISKALGSIDVVVWGDYAIGAYGVPTVVDNFMIVPSPADYNKTVAKLKAEGFIHINWSYAIADPNKWSTDPQLRLSLNRIINEHKTIDDNSERFLFPPFVDFSTVGKIVVLRSRYVNMTPPDMSRPELLSSKDWFGKSANVFYPHPVALLKSLIHVYLQSDPSARMWRAKLRTWSIAYLYGHLMLDDDCLDDGPRTEINEWFDSAIRRYSGGLDRNRRKWIHYD